MTIRRVRGDEAVQIDQENQAAVRCNRGARKSFTAPEIVAQILDDDFILAEDFLDNDAHMLAGNLGDHHVEVAVQWFGRWQGQLQVETHNLGDHVAYTCEQLSTYIFYVRWAQASNFFYDGEGQRKHRSAATDEQRLRDNQRERHLHRERSATAQFGANFDLSVQCVNVGAHDIQSHSSSRKFSGRRSRGESWTE